MSDSSASSGASGTTSSTASASAKAAFSAAKAEWKQAAQVPLATTNTYILKAASDLRHAADSGYSTAISQLTYLGNLPNSNLTPTQQAKGEADHKALNSFFGTPGLA